MKTEGDGDEAGADGESPRTVTVEMSRELLRDIDAFAAHHGYESPDAVVAAALARANEESED